MFTTSKAMFIGSLLATGLASRCYAEPAAKTTPTAGENFVVVPVKTELQKLFGGLAKADVFVLLNGWALAKDESTVDANAINVHRVREALQRYRSSEGSVHFRINCEYIPGVFEKQSGRNSFNLLALAFRQLGLEAGFAGVEVEVEHNSDRSKFGHLPNDWTSAATSLLVNAKADPDKESGVGDNLVRLYRVNTGLSRALFGNVDCVIRVHAPMDEVGADIMLRIQRHLHALDLDRKTRVLFLVEFGKDSRFGQRRYKELIGNPKMVREMLGFKQARVMTWGSIKSQ